MTLYRGLDIGSAKPNAEEQRRLHHHLLDMPAVPSPKVACIVRPREELRRRIADRIFAMLQAGWIDEAKDLFARSPPPGREARQAVGYEEIAKHLAGRLSYEDLVETVTTR